MLPSVRCSLLTAGPLMLKVQEMAAELAATLAKTQLDKQSLANANAALKSDLNSLREQRESAEAKVSPASAAYKPHLLQSLRKSAVKGIVHQMMHTGSRFPQPSRDEPRSAAIVHGTSCKTWQGSHRKPLRELLHE